MIVTWYYHYSCHPLITYFLFNSSYYTTELCFRVVRTVTYSYRFTCLQILHKADWFHYIVFVFIIEGSRKETLSIDIGNIGRSRTLFTFCLLISSHIDLINNLVRSRVSYLEYSMFRTFDLFPIYSCRYSKLHLITYSIIISFHVCSTISDICGSRNLLLWWKSALTIRIVCNLSTL